MSMRQSIRDLYMKLINEKLLRLLYYPPEDLGKSIPDPLSPSNPDILSLPADQKWAIIDDRILLTPKTDDLDNPKCRLMFYPGRRYSTNTNYLFANQEIIFDILVHFSFERDQRSMWICDTINEIIFNQRITGVGKVLYKQGGQINSPDGYVGYRLVYEFISENY
jgi:hypothetical protein